MAMLTVAMLTMAILTVAMLTIAVLTTAVNEKRRSLSFSRRGASSSSNAWPRLSTTAPPGATDANRPPPVSASEDRPLNSPATRRLSCLQLSSSPLADLAACNSPDDIRITLPTDLGGDEEVEKGAHVAQEEKQLKLRVVQVRSSTRTSMSARMSARGGQGGGKGGSLGILGIEVDANNVVVRTSPWP